MIKIGVIGLSEGNGHPYSWSAIFNGYNRNKYCPFDVIPNYLNQQKFPEDFLSHLGKVTHIWTQDNQISKSVAEFSLIENIVDNLHDMIGEVDAVLLARDDAENHYKMVLPFLKAGLPVFIDKPFAVSLKDADLMLKNQSYSSQIFTTSSLRFADELLLNEDDLSTLGEIQRVEAKVMKKWSTYAIHLLEPIVVNLPNRGNLIEVKKIYDPNHHVVNVKWQKVESNLTITGKAKVPLEFTYIGSIGKVKKTFTDAFTSFKSSLEAFIVQLKTNKISIDRNETLELVNIIEQGL